MNEDTSNASEPTLTVRMISAFSVLMASIGILVCSGFLIDTLITHKPRFDISSLIPFNINDEQLGFLYFMVYIIGIGFILVSYSIIDLRRRKSPSLSLFFFAVGFTMAITSVILLILYDGLSWETDSGLIFSMLQSIAGFMVVLFGILARFSIRAVLKVMQYISILLWISIGLFNIYK